MPLETSGPAGTAGWGQLVAPCEGLQSWMIGLCVPPRLAERPKRAAPAAARPLHRSGQPRTLCPALLPLSATHSHLIAPLYFNLPCLQAVDADPTPQALTGRASVHNKLKNYMEAAADASRAAELDEELAEAHKEKG